MNSLTRIETRLTVCTVLVGGLYVPALFCLWLLARMADQVGALRP